MSLGCRRDVEGEWALSPGGPASRQGAGSGGTH